MDNVNSTELLTNDTWVTSQLKKEIFYFIWINLS